MKKTITAATGLLLLTGVVTGCGTGSTTGNGAGGGTTGTTGGTVTLQFLQNKTEAVGEFNTLIKQFEQANPNIKVQQLNPPNADTVLQTDLTKNQLPDVIAMGADATYVEMAQAGVLKTFSGSSELQNVNDTYVKMLQNEVGKSDPYGIPYTVNAEPILYNKDLFAKYNLTVPQTWDEVMADAAKVKAAGGTPFYFGFKDAWTTMVPWNALAANNQGANFFSDIKAGNTSFAKSYPTVAQRMVQLSSYGQSNQFGTGYNDANTAFANGKSVFYVQGDWAISSILQANPNVKLGSFAFPATNDPSTNKLVSGIDSVLTVSQSSKHQAEAQKFIDFLLQKDNAQAYSDNQKLFSAVNGVTQSDPVVSGLQTFIDKGQISDYPDHYYPPALDANMANMIQGFLVKKTPVPTFLSQVDAAYQKAAQQQ